MSNPSTPTPNGSTTPPATSTGLSKGQAEPTLESALHEAMENATKFFSTSGAKSPEDMLVQLQERMNLELQEHHFGIEVVEEEIGEAEGELRAILSKLRTLRKRRAAHQQALETITETQIIMESIQ